MPELSIKERVSQACFTSLKAASDSGVTKAVLGASVEAIRALTDGKPMHAPFGTYQFDVADAAGEVQQVKTPIFCDPGLEGLAVYCVAWPEQPGETKVFTAGEEQ